MNTPELAVRIVIMPLDVDVPSPVARLSAPPVCTVLRPVSMLTRPPAPLVPLPAEMLTSPPRPTVAAPLPRSSDPLLPVLDVPEEKISMPLTPLVPELAVRIVIMPLDVDVPSPVATLNAPPVCTVLRPVTTSCMCRRSRNLEDLSSRLWICACRQLKL